MEVRELRIRNRFRTVDDKTELTVCGITKHDEREPACIWYGNEGGFFLTEDECEPIPITEEWLVRLGFEKNNEEVHYSYIINEIYKVRFLGIDLFYFEMHGMRINLIKYVHQLQNLYFALTGEELPINTTFP